MSVADVDGSWDCVIKSPLGDMATTLTIATSGATFGGTSTGVMGSAEVVDGRIEGDRLSWKMKVTAPMALMLDCEAHVAGDRLSGSVGAGQFGTFPMTGTRTG